MTAEVDAAAVTVAEGRGTLKTMAATEDRAAFIEPLRMQTGRGPCMDCFRTGEARGIPDITAERDAGRSLVPAMSDSGYRASHTLPLRLQERPLGAATPLNTRVGSLSEGDARPARALADSAALSLMLRSTEPARVDDVITRVRSAIAAEAILEIAKGMIAVYGNIAIGEAGRRLTDYARHHRVSLANTAHALVSRTTDPTVIVGDPHGS
ncbi:GAF and ANTAR domain-containing protein [Streptomyces phaeoluteigriseus]|uniref:GAF and ANTAR domain-containing protein n=1 Tax=Streptomyces phaeoluteigriseus TaxID=114686 RepID=A0ABY4ZK06_9ACTN|nr:GAF and ANTAR domain-containing protein [Streptomyces phaeoluteigriseus]USQ89237.1 GAF and ANTAR domain-containing protein [Streptomyces phaeoluteigriseus]